MKQKIIYYFKRYALPVLLFLVALLEIHIAFQCFADGRFMANVTGSFAICASIWLVYYSVELIKKHKNNGTV